MSRSPPQHGRSIELISYLLQLTKRITKDKEKIDMCGIPVHALDNYLQRLIKKGVMVAICEQTGSVDEAKRARTRVKREITRLYVSFAVLISEKCAAQLFFNRITPGTLTEERWLEAKSANYLASVFVPKQSESSTQAGSLSSASAPFGLCWVDLSTGEFYVSTTSRSYLCRAHRAYLQSWLMLPPVCR